MKRLLPIVLFIACAGATLAIAAGAGAQDIDWDRATGALQRALIRLKVAEYAPRKRSVAVPGQ